MVSLCDRLEQGQVIGTLQIHMLQGQRRQAFDIILEHHVSFCTQIIECILHGRGVPKKQDSNDQTKCPKLVFLALSIALAKFPFLAVKHLTRDGMPPFPSIELDLNPATKKLIVSVREQVQTLRDSPDLTDRPR
jgi:hypothetical protein